MFFMPGLVPGHELVALVVAEKRSGNWNRPRGIEDMYDGARVIGSNLDSGVGRRSGGATDEEGDRECLALHLRGDVHHFVKRRGDQTGEANDVSALLARGSKDFFAGDHHSEIDHLEPIACQHHAHDVLADVVHVPLDGGHHDPASRTLIGIGGLFLFHEGGEPGHCFLHHPG